MENSILEQYLFGEAEPGEVMLIEYSSTEFIEHLIWGKILPELSERGEVVVIDFYGIGDVFFRNYEKKAGSEDYLRILDIINRTKVIKIGTGSSSFGELIETFPISESSRDFLKKYYTAMNRIKNLPRKPEYVLVLGLSEYFHLHDEPSKLRNFLLAFSTIPVYDWKILSFINVEIIRPEILSLLEEVSSAVFVVSGGKITPKKVRWREHRDGQ